MIKRRHPVGPCIAAACLCLSLVGSVLTADSRSAPPAVRIRNDHPAVETAWYGVELDAKRPFFTSFWVDSLGKHRVWPNAMIVLDRPRRAYRRIERDGWIRYEAANHTGGITRFRFDGDRICVRSEFTGTGRVEPFAMHFRTAAAHPAYATLLGHFAGDGSIRLPAVLHIPGQGTLRLTARTADGRPKSLGYFAIRGRDNHVDITLPAASAACPWVEVDLRVVQIHPNLAGLADDARFDGFRRCWLNALQLNPQYRLLANHAASDVASVCYHEYGEIAMVTPPLAPGVTAANLLRESLDRFLGGAQAYCMHGYSKGEFPRDSLDTWPSIVTACHQYFLASQDHDWVKTHCDKLIEWGEKILALDTDGNGLIEYWQSGNRGDWQQVDGRRVRPANWWDCINFGHEDAYSNALAYRALRGLARMMRDAGRADQATRFQAAANHIKAVYFKTFYNPKTGMLAGWKSRDGQLHDYAFTFIQGYAITYGVVDNPVQANGLMDAMFRKLNEVGYDRFEFGLPGNLIVVPADDYYEPSRRWGGSGAFQVYENGGASANHVYFTLAALYKLGRREQADEILLPILNSLNNCRFQGRGTEGLSNDWRGWDGRPHGYEGLLVDNYLVVKAVLVRAGRVDSTWGSWIR